MAIQAPFSAGSTYQRNQTSWSITLTQPIPAGSMIWLVGGGSLPDTATLTISDAAGNSYFQQVFSQQPGTTGTMLAFIAAPAKALASGSVLTISSSTKADMIFSLFCVVGANGSLYSTDVEWNAGSQPSATVACYEAGMGVFAVLAVAGPSNDGFVQANGWGTDLTPNITTVNATLHTGFKISADATLQTYAPTLGSARQNVLMLASFY